MKGFEQNIEDIAVKNQDFRQVLYTAKNCQSVVMPLKPHEEISAGFAILVPAGANHNIINTGDAALKLCTLYAPPNHRDGVIHHTRADAEADNEKFDGKATE